ncbi:hypothetical protein BC332_01916 [Capsicum chinense]|nr:hypothetical protein BC332_01916 [Capsicum chinense]
MNLEDTNRITKLFNLFNIFLKGVISIALNIPGTKFYHAKKATNTIRELLLIVKQRREAIEQRPNSPPQDLLSHLLLFPDENGKFMSELEIADNILMMIFGGHDTTTVTLTLVMKYLAELPHVYANILQGQSNTIIQNEAFEMSGLHKQLKPFLNLFSYKMTIYVNMLGSLVEYGMSSYLDGSFAVIKHLKGNVTVTPSSLYGPVSQVTSATIVAMLLNSASAELLDTIFYFFDFQEIKASPNFTR